MTCAAAVAFAWAALARAVAAVATAGLLAGGEPAAEHESIPISQCSAVIQGCAASE